MTDALIHVHQPRVSTAVGTCPVCCGPLGPDPVLVRVAAGEEWVSRDCFLRIERLLVDLGAARVRRWMAS